MPSLTYLTPAQYSALELESDLLLNKIARITVMEAESAVMKFVLQEKLKAVRFTLDSQRVIKPQTEVLS